MKGAASSQLGSAVYGIARPRDDDDLDPPEVGRRLPILAAVAAVLLSWVVGLLLLKLALYVL